MPRILKPGKQSYIVFGVLFTFPVSLIAYATMRTGQFEEFETMAGVLALGYVLICAFICGGRVIVTPEYLAVRSAIGTEQRLNFRDVVASIAVPNHQRASYLEFYSQTPGDKTKPSFVLSLKTLHRSDIHWLLSQPQIKLVD